MHQRHIKIWASALLMFAETGSRLFAQTLVSAGEARFIYNLTGQERVPFWNGALIILEHNGLAVPIIHSFDLTGAALQPIVFAIPGASATRIERVARDRDGTYSVCGRTFDAEGKGGGFIAWISPDRQNTKVVQTFPYVPYLTVMTADGSTWTQGLEIAHGREADSAVAKENGIIRRFDKAGKLLSSYIPRSTFVGTALALQQGLLAASSKDYIGWYANHVHEYYEITINGQVSAYPGIGPAGSKWETTGLAVTSDGDVIISASERVQNGGAPRLYRLDKLRRTWLSLNSDPLPPRPLLLGNDRSRLILYQRDRMQFVDVHD